MHGERYHLNGIAQGHRAPPAEVRTRARADDDEFIISFEYVVCVQFECEIFHTRARARMPACLLFAVAAAAARQVGARSVTPVGMG